jgi:hypothetical protein
LVRTPFHGQLENHATQPHTTACRHCPMPRIGHPQLSPEPIVQEDARTVNPISLPISVWGRAGAGADGAD